MKKKAYARDVQERTGWKYQFCKRLVETIGYEEVSREIDATDDLVSLGRRLNERAKVVDRERSKGAEG